MSNDTKTLSMTTKEEQSHFEWHARTVYSGVGEIADLGCWLGSTTISLARGLSRNPLAAASEKKVHAFDRFLWEDWMDAFVSETPLGRNYRPGESFLDEFQHRTRPWAERITVYMGDLCQLPWIGHEIEILLIDAMKSWDLANAIVSKFFPYLIPQQSYIFHQDFAHCHTPWIHLIQYRFRRFFEPLHLVSRSTTFVFKHAASIPSAMLGIEFSPKCFSKEEIDDAFEYSLSLISDRSAQARVAAAKILLWVQLGETVHADRELDRFLRLGFPIVSDMKVVMQKLGRAPEPPRGGGGKSLKAIKTLAKLARRYARRSRALMDRGLVSLKPARTRMLERLIKDAPRFHSANGALTSWSVQAETLRYLDSVLEPGMKTLETGCGQTTVVFAIARTRHVCVTPNREEVDRVQRYCAQLGLEPSLVFIVDSSDKALPRGDVVPRDLDLIFIDGAHAFPAPILDWHYSARGLKIGGLLAVDDYKMPSVKMLFDFLRGEEEWELLSIVQNTAFFRKRAEMKALADWRGQKINSQYPGY